MADDITLPQPDAEQFQRTEAMRRDMHAFFDSLPRLTDQEKADRKAAYDAEHNGAAVMHGVVQPPPETPEDRARRQIDERNPPLAVSDETMALYQVEEDRCAALVGYEREQALRDTIARAGGETAYRELIAQAKVGLNESWRAPLELSFPMLQLLAAHGRYASSWQRQRDALEQSIAARKAGGR